MDIYLGSKGNSGKGNNIGKGGSLRDVGNKDGKESFVENTLILKPNLVICHSKTMETREQTGLK